MQAEPIPCVFPARLQCVLVDAASTEQRTSQKQQRTLLHSSLAQNQSQARPCHAVAKMAKDWEKESDYG